MDVRPEPPDDDDTPQLSDAVWKLAEICWVKDPKRRPTASAVCDTIISVSWDEDVCVWHTRTRTLVSGPSIGTWRALLP